MLRIFNVNITYLKGLLCLLLLLAGYLFAHSMHQRSECKTERSVLFPSPNGKWYAKADAITCSDASEKMQVYLLRTPNDRIRLQVYSSAYQSKFANNISWKGSDELVIAIPKSVHPDFAPQRYAGVNVSYAIY